LLSYFKTACFQQKKMLSSKNLLDLDKAQISIRDSNILLLLLMSEDLHKMLGVRTAVKDVDWNAH